MGLRRGGDERDAGGAGGAVLQAAARFLRPVLAAAALVALFLLVPGRSPHPAIQAADTLLADALDVHEAWLRWSLRQDPPEPGTVIILFAEPGP